MTNTKEKRKALFLDRDGVINVDKAYVYRFIDIEWMEGIIDLIQYAHQKGMLVIVLTNQSGVAQGMYQEREVVALHAEMQNYLKSKNAEVDDWYYCIEYDSEKRKPRPGMMIEARDKFNIDLYSSYMIGDKPSDILEIEGPKTFLLQGNYSLETVKESKKAEIFFSLKEILERLKLEL